VTDRTRQAADIERTCSAGFATWDREESGLELAGRAHKALRRAQRAGGDRAVRAEDPVLPD
jgi:GGDEF domain-containing protein